jgi:hypothetical protein
MSWLICAGTADQPLSPLCTTTSHQRAVTVADQLLRRAHFTRAVVLWADDNRPIEDFTVPGAASPTWLQILP